MSYVVIIGMLFAFWVYRDAKKWGYAQKTAMLWAMGTVVFPYVLVPVYFLFARRFQIRPREQRREEDLKTIEAEAVFGGEMVDCPMCAAKVSEEKSVCPRCGYSLKLTCTACGRALQRDWKACPYCQTAAPEK